MKKHYLTPYTFKYWHANCKTSVKPLAFLVIIAVLPLLLICDFVEWAHK